MNRNRKAKKYDQRMRDEQACFMAADMDFNDRSVDDVKRPFACCGKAVPINCVCAYSYDCPDHGAKHIGSHD